jgi:hypothetical protein
MSTVPLLKEETFVGSALANETLLNVEVTAEKYPKSKGKYKVLNNFISRFEI